MSRKKSLEAYTEKRLNCAQSVLSGFKDSHGVTDEEIIEAKIFGGGRAPENRCGALHAAMKLLSDTPCGKGFEEQFSMKAGSTKCREIRAQGKLSCAGCVELAAELLEKTAGKKAEE